MSHSEDLTMSHTVSLAARELHYSAEGIPDDYARDVAQKAMSDLIDRFRGRELTRDERRLFEKYQGQLDAAKDRMVATARAKGLLPNTKVV